MKPSSAKSREFKVGRFLPKPQFCWGQGLGKQEEKKEKEGTLY
jgi:hypothetical protein